MRYIFWAWIMPLSAALMSSALLAYVIAEGIRAADGNPDLVALAWVPAIPCYAAVIWFTFCAHFLGRDIARDGGL